MRVNASTCFPRLTTEHVELRQFSPVRVQNRDAAAKEERKSGSPPRSVVTLEGPRGSPRHRTGVAVHAERQSVAVTAAAKIDDRGTNFVVSAVAETAAGLATLPAGRAAHVIVSLEAQAAAAAARQFQLETEVAMLTARLRAQLPARAVATTLAIPDARARARIVSLARGADIDVGPLAELYGAAGTSAKPHKPAMGARGRASNAKAGGRANDTKGSRAPARTSPRSKSPRATSASRTWVVSAASNPGDDRFHVHGSVPIVAGICVRLGSAQRFVASVSGDEILLDRPMDVPLAAGVDVHEVHVPERELAAFVAIDAHRWIRSVLVEEIVITAAAAGEAGTAASMRQRAYESRLVPKSVVCTTRLHTQAASMGQFLTGGPDGMFVVSSGRELKLAALSPQARPEPRRVFSAIFGAASLLGLDGVPSSELVRTFGSPAWMSVMSSLFSAMNVTFEEVAGRAALLSTVSAETFARCCRPPHPAREILQRWNNDSESATDVARVLPETTCLCARSIATALDSLRGEFSGCSLGDLRALVDAFLNADTLCAGALLPWQVVVACEALDGERVDEDEIVQFVSNRGDDARDACSLSHSAVCPCTRSATSLSLLSSAVLKLDVLAFAQFRVAHAGAVVAAVRAAEAKSVISHARAVLSRTASTSHGVPRPVAVADGIGGRVHSVEQAIAQGFVSVCSTVGATRVSSSSLIDALRIDARGAKALQSSALWANLTVHECLTAGGASMSWAQVLGAVFGEDYMVISPAHLRVLPVAEALEVLSVGSRVVVLSRTGVLSCCSMALGGSLLWNMPVAVNTSLATKTCFLFVDSDVHESVVHVNTTSSNGSCLMSAALLEFDEFLLWQDVFHHSTFRQECLSRGCGCLYSLEGSPLRADVFVCREHIRVDCSWRSGDAKSIVAWSAGGALVSSHSSSAVIQICCAYTGALVAVAAGHTSLAPVLSPTVGACAGTTCIVSGGCNGADFAVRVWDLSGVAASVDTRLRTLLDGDATLCELFAVPCIAVLNGHPARIEGVAWLPASGAFVSWSSDTLNVWDASSGAHRYVNPCLQINMCQLINTILAGLRFQRVVQLGMCESLEATCTCLLLGRPVDCFRDRGSTCRFRIVRSLEYPYQRFIARARIVAY